MRSLLCCAAMLAVHSAEVRASEASPSDLAGAADRKAAATEAFKVVEPEIMRAATKGIVHKNTASRKVSRLAARLKSVGA